MQNSWRTGNAVRAFEQHLQQRAALAAQHEHDEEAEEEQAVPDADDECVEITAASQQDKDIPDAAAAAEDATSVTSATDAGVNRTPVELQAQWPPPVRVRRYYPLPANTFSPLPPPALNAQQAELRARQPRAAVAAAMDALLHDEGVDGDEGAERETVAVPLPPQTPLPIAVSSDPQHHVAGSDGCSVMTASPPHISSARSASQAQGQPPKQSLIAMVTQRRRGKKRSLSPRADEQEPEAINQVHQHEAEAVEVRADPAEAPSSPVWVTINDAYVAEKLRREHAEEEAEIAAFFAARRASGKRRKGVPALPKDGFIESPRLARVMDLVRSSAFSRSGSLVFDGYHSLVRTSLFGPDPSVSPDDDLGIVVEHGALLRITELPGVMLHVETHEHAIAGAAEQMMMESDVKPNVKPERRGNGGGGKRRRTTAQQPARSRTAGGSTDLALVGLFVEDAMHSSDAAQSGSSSSPPRLLPAYSRALGLPDGEVLVASVPQLRALLTTVLKAAATAAAAADDNANAIDLELSPTLIEA